MELTTRELWALIHGVILGGAFLLAFSGGLVGFYSLRPELVSGRGRPRADAPAQGGHRGDGGAGLAHRDQRESTSSVQVEVTVLRVRIRVLGSFGHCG